MPYKRMPGIVSKITKHHRKVLGKVDLSHRVFGERLEKTLDNIHVHGEQHRCVAAILFSETEMAGRLYHPLGPDEAQPEMLGGRVQF